MMMFNKIISFKKHGKKRITNHKYGSLAIYSRHCLLKLEMLYRIQNLIYNIFVNIDKGYIRGHSSFKGVRLFN